MKRIILRLILAAVTFAFGVAIDRGVNFRQPVAPLTSRQPTAPQAHNDEAAGDIPVRFLYPLEARQPTGLLDYNLAKFEPTGSYFPLTTLPKEFAEVGFFDITVSHVDGESWGTAYVETERGKAHDFRSAEFLLITERRVFFVTAAHEDNGFAYRFEGNFLANPASEMDSGRAVVKGTLSKTKNGRTVAECKVSFEVKYLGC